MYSTLPLPRRPADNHHHDVYLTGKHSRMAKVPYDPLDLTIPQMARPFYTCFTAIAGHICGSFAFSCVFLSTYREKISNVVDNCRSQLCAYAVV